MGRSVNYHSDAYKILYTHLEMSDTHEDEEGNEVKSDYDDYQFEWECFEDNIIYGLQEVAPSLEPPYKKIWHDHEVRMILENNLCSVWLSEYCGLVSLSFVAQDYKVPLAEHWLDQMFPKFEKKINPTLRKLFTMSNGEAIFEKINT